MEDNVIMNEALETTAEVVEEIVETMPVKSNSKGRIGKGLMIASGLGLTIYACKKIVDRVAPGITNKINNHRAKKLRRAGYEVFTPEEMSAVDELVNDSID